MKLNKIVIIGTGLIGGSIGKALVKENLAGEVAGVFRSASSMKRAEDAGAITVGKGYVNEYEKAVSGADVIIIATPVHAIKETLDRIARTLKDKKVIVTDVGSTKKEICEYAAKYADMFTFIGAHPMAGSEKTGVENSRADLFKGSVCLLMKDDRIDKALLGKLDSFWKALGAKVLLVTPEEHDRSLAYSSHLPHVVAYALAGTAEKEFPAAMAATGFKDTTRIASSDAVIWTDIFMSNQQYLLEAIGKYKAILEKIENCVQKGKEEELQEYLKNYKRVRDELFK